MYKCEQTHRFKHSTSDLSRGRMYLSIITGYLLVTTTQATEDFSLILRDRQVKIYNANRIDLISVTLDKSILTTNLNDTLNKIKTFVPNFEQSDLERYYQFQIALLVDRIVASANQVALDLKFIELFTGLSETREEGGCQIKITTVNNNLIELLETSTNYAITVITARITKATFESSHGALNSLQQQINQIEKNTSRFHKLTYTMDRATSNSDIVYFLKSTECIPRNTNFLIKDSYCSNSECYIIINYVTVTHTLTKYSTIAYDNKSLCYPYLYYAKDEFYSAACEKCVPLRLPAKEDNCLKDLLDDPGAPIDHCNTCNNSLQLITGKFGTICQAEAYFQAIMTTPATDLQKQLTYDYIRSNDSKISFNIKSEFKLRPPVLILSTQPFVIRIHNKKYIFKGNSNKNLLKEGKLTIEQHLRLSQPNYDIFENIEIMDLVLPSSISTITLLMILILRYMCFKVKRRLTKRTLENKLQRIQTGARKNRTSKQLVSFLNEQPTRLS